MPWGCLGMGTDSVYFPLVMVQAVVAVHHVDQKFKIQMLRSMKNKRILDHVPERLGGSCRRGFLQRAWRPWRSFLGTARKMLSYLVRILERHLSIPVNLLEIKEIQSVVPKAKEFLGGRCGPSRGRRRPWLEGRLLSHGDFLKLFALNLGAAAEINRLVFPEMKRKARG